MNAAKELGICYPCLRITVTYVSGPNNPEVRGICFFRCHPAGIRFLAVLFLTACLLTTGCGRTINRAAERRIRDALPQYIGTARTWRAHVDNPPERTISGKLSRITIDGEGVDFGETIRLDRLHIDMVDAVFDVDSK